MKRILSLILTLALICAAFPAGADTFDRILTAQEIQTCLELAAMDGQSAGWSAGSSVSERMDALQVQQYLTWLLEDGVGGLIRRMEDGAQLERVTGGTAYGNAALMAQAQRLTQAESGAGFAVQALSSRQFGFVVRDDKGDPLPGASVTVVCSGNAA